MNQYDKSSKPLQGSDLERITGVSRSTVHSYIKKGLLSKPVRSGKTMAYYSSVHLDELEEIKKLRKLGYPLSYIRDIMDEKRQISESQPREDEDPAERKELILEKAVEIFSSKGYHNTKMGDIAEAAGTSKSSLYLFYENKQLLFLECADKVLEAMTSDITSSIKEEENPIKQLFKISEVVLRSYPHFLEILNSVDNMVEENPELKEKGRDIYSRAASIVTGEYHQIVSTGFFSEFPREVNEEFLSFLSIGLVKSFHSLFLLFDEYSVDDFIQLTDFAARLFSPLLGA
ncbi:MAG: MerR family transcriptional regulator [Actinobacteria bacterium]|nr:MerR family transcriptional regulator [Actinomycetota bacterium]